MTAYNTNTEYYMSEPEYDNWEEYISDDNDNYQVEQPQPLAVKKPKEETPQERQEREEREEKIKKELEMIKDKLNWVDQEKKIICINTDLDTKEFPNLSPKIIKKDRVQLKPIRPNKISNTKFIITGKSYSEESKEKIKREFDNEIKRKVAFETLANKETLDKKLIKTKICNSLEKIEKCPHGENCRFAHSLDELNISNCLFGQQCRFVRCFNGNVVNTGKKTCHHKHPDESVDCFFKRTGLDKYKKKSCEPLVLDLKKGEIDYQKDRMQGINWATKLKPTNVDNQLAIKTKISSTQITSEVNEIILRVPKELAMQAMELTLKNSTKSIRVEII